MRMIPRMKWPHEWFDDAKQWLHNVGAFTLVGSIRVPIVCLVTDSLQKVYICFRVKVTWIELSTSAKIVRCFSGLYNTCYTLNVISSHCFRPAVARRTAFNPYQLWFNVKKWRKMCEIWYLLDIFIDLKQGIFDAQQSESKYATQDVSESYFHFDVERANHVCPVNGKASR